MADAKLTALTAASALAGADLFYISQGGVSKKATHTQLLTLVGTTYVPLAGGTMTGPLISSSSLSGSNFYVNPNGNIGFNTPATGFLFWDDSGDVRLYRDAAATLAQRNGTTQQIFRLYNTYTDASNYERLTLTGVAGTSVNITAETMGTGADNIDIVLTPAGSGKTYIGPSGAYVNASGTIYSPATCILLNILSGDSFSLNYYNTGLQLASNAPVSWTSGLVSASADVGYARNAAGIVEVNNGTAGTFRDLKLRNLLNVEYHQMTEMTAPSAPATNSVRIYAEDNGAGKTRLMALFATGAAQQIAIEP